MVIIFALLNVCSVIKLIDLYFEQKPNTIWTNIDVKLR